MQKLLSHMCGCCEIVCVLALGLWKLFESRYGDLQCTLEPFQYPECWMAKTVQGRVYLHSSMVSGCASTEVKLSYLQATLPGGSACLQAKAIF